MLTEAPLGRLVRLSALKGPRDGLLHRHAKDLGHGLAECVCGIQGRPVTPDEWDLKHFERCVPCGA